MTPADLWPAILYTLFAWWFSTGAILWLVRLPRSTFPWTMGGSTLVAAASVYALYATRNDASAIGAYLAFTAALCIWGWHEVSFLLGFVLGPRTIPCPPEARGWRRFRLATATLIYHELALLATAAALVAMTWGATNQIGVWTFLILFAMRLSAKLNLFLGVPNLSQEFFPKHLEHLKSYLPKRAINALFPVSVVASGALAVGLLQTARGENATALEIAGLTLLFALTSLALVEHVFMVVPLPDAALWRWAIGAPPPRPDLATVPPPPTSAARIMSASKEQI